MKFKVLLIFICAFFGCLPSENTDNTDLKCTYDIGQQQLSGVSKAFLPFEGKKVVTFVDTLGLKKQFDLFVNIKQRRLQNKIFIRDTIWNGKSYKAGDIYNCLTQDVLEYNIKDQGGPMHLRISIAQEFDLGFIEKSPIEVMNIQIAENGDIEDADIYYKEITNALNSNNLPTIDYDTYDELWIWNKFFTNVKKMKIRGLPKHEVWFNRAQGIVRFTETTGRRWRFDSIK